MKKRSIIRIIAFMLAVLMFAGTLPVSVLADSVSDLSALLAQSGAEIPGITGLPAAESQLPASDNEAVGDVENTQDTFQVRKNADGMSYTVVGFLSSARTMNIPSEYNGFPVTRIGEFAFSNKKNLENVTIPDSIVYIGTEAFSGCDRLLQKQKDKYAKQGLNVAYLGNDSNPYLYLWRAIDTEMTEVRMFEPTNADVAKGRVTRFVSSYAFQYCTKLTEITIPDSVIQIGYKALRHTDSLVSVTLPFCGETGDSTENTHFGYVFGAQTYGGNISYVPTTLRSIHITGGTRMTKNSFYGIDFVETLSLPFVGDRAVNPENTYVSYIFGGNSYEDNANLPASLTTINILGGEIIDDYAFYGCIALSNISIPDSVKSIGEEAFYRCSSLISVTIGNGVTSIGKDVFYGCSSLNTVNIKDISAWCNISFGNDLANPLHYARNLYLNGALVKELIIPEGVTIIDSYAFYNCSSLTSITIPDSVTSIGYNAFRGCSSLTSATIGNSVTSIGSYAFSYCRSLTSVTIGNSVTSIGNDAFYDCSNLTTITIPDSVTSIGYEVDWLKKHKIAKCQPYALNYPA